MTTAAVVDRVIGCYQPTPKVGNLYPDTMPILEARVGRKFDVYSTFIDYTLDYPGRTVPAPAGQTGTPSATPVAPHTDIANAVTVSGRDLLIAFQPAKGYWNRGDGVYVARWGTFGELLAGAYDAQIDAIFGWLLSLRKPDTSAPTVYVRPFWEANILNSYWFPADSSNKSTGMAATGSTGTGTSATMTTYGRVWTNDAGDPVCASIAQYKAAFAYFTARVKALTGGSRIKVAYVPGNTDARAEMDRGSAGCTVANMLPPDSVIDYVGYDIYNGLQSQWTSAVETLRGIRMNDLDSTLATAKGVTITRGSSAPTAQPYAYDLLAALSTKPLLIGETNCVDKGDKLDTGNLAAAHSKGQWYRDLFALPGSTLPRLEVICLFNSPGTRTTYPLTSSADAEAGFIDGFNYGADGAQHGTVAPAYDPDTATGFADPDPTDSLVDDPVIGTVGARGNDALHRTARFFLRKIARKDAAGNVSLTGTSDGSRAAVTAGADMGNAFQPIVQLNAPAVVGGVRKYVLGVAEAGSAKYLLQVRSDGRQAFGSGAADPDVFLARPSAGKLDVTGTGGVDARFGVADLDVERVNFAGQAAPSAPASGSGVLYADTSGDPQWRTALGVKALTPNFTQDDRLFASTVMPVSPFNVNTSSSGPILTAGVMMLLLLEVPTARTVTQLGVGIQNVGASLGACYVAAYAATGGAQLAVTGDVSATWGASVGYKVHTISGGGSVASGQRVWVGVLCASGTTMPRICGVGNSIGGLSITRFGTYGSSLATPPSTLGTVTLGTNAIFLTLT